LELKRALILFVISAASATAVSQTVTKTQRDRTVTSTEAIAIINIQSGDALFRARKGENNFRLTKRKDLGKELYAPQEIRCEKNCMLELLLCTGGKVVLKEKDGWYRIPVLACTKDKFIPGFKNYLMPGGRRAKFLNAPSSSMGERVGAITGDVSGITGDILGAILAARPKCSPDYEGAWSFEYPFEGAEVIPELFEFTVSHRGYVRPSPTLEKFHMLFTLTAFDKKDRITPSKQISELFDFEIGGQANPQDLALTNNKFQAFLREEGKNYDRIFCTITLNQATIATSPSTGNNEPHTFGFEFYVADDQQAQATFDSLAKSDAEGGIARFLGRADVFESLGLWRLARAEYRKALDLSPDNKALWSKFSRITNPCIETER
jgi:hypothetical protein